MTNDTDNIPPSSLDEREEIAIKMLTSWYNVGRENTAPVHLSINAFTGWGYLYLYRKAKPEWWIHAEEEFSQLPPEDIIFRYDRGSQRFVIGVRL